MSRHGVVGVTCDYIHPQTLQDFVGYVGASGGSRALYLVDVVAVGRARWNTPNGLRPTQMQANAMPVDPTIVTPLTMRVVRRYIGPDLPDPFIAFAPAGAIADEARSSCSLQAYGGRVHTWGGSAVGPGRYVAFLGRELLSGSATGPIVMPTVDDLFVVRGTKVLGPSLTLEPLPAV